MNNNMNQESDEQRRTASEEYDPLHLAKPGEKTVICPECGLPVPESMKYCPYCGIRMRGGCMSMVIKLLCGAAVVAAAVWLICKLF
ncbi:MAG: zinc ribbon domain-containing protein [Alistipes sp.]|nr:zinc ribbon domain-containing protein [Alistipes sp.]MDE7129223.1 zinc ribbon domain-containing protein [Alistipes sp.]